MVRRFRLAGLEVNDDTCVLGLLRARGNIPTSRTQLVMSALNRAQRAPRRDLTATGRIPK
jgi:hypothetical protein